VRVDFTLQELVGVSACGICALAYSRCLIGGVSGAGSKALDYVVERGANRLAEIGRSARCVAMVQAPDRSLEVPKVAHQLAHTSPWIADSGLAKHGWSYRSDVAKGSVIRSPLAAVRSPTTRLRRPEWFHPHALRPTRFARRNQGRIAASYAFAGRLQDARRAIAQMREAIPNMRLFEIMDRSPFRRPDDWKRYAEGLRMAGLPE